MNKYHMDKVAWNWLFAAIAAVVRKPQQPVPTYNLQISNLNTLFLAASLHTNLFFCVCARNVLPNYFLHFIFLA